MKQVDKDAIRRWRKRGFYTENALVKLLQKNGYNAVRIPVSNPSLSPLPDIIARKNSDMYAFEVKNAKFYAYFPKLQIEKLFRFLNELVPLEKEHKHAVLGAHLGKRWIFKEIPWRDYDKGKLPGKARILKRDRGNFVANDARHKNHQSKTCIKSTGVEPNELKGFINCSTFPHQDTAADYPGL